MRRGERGSTDVSDSGSDASEVEDPRTRRRPPVRDGVEGGLAGGWAPCGAPSFRWSPLRWSRGTEISCSYER